MSSGKLYSNGSAVITTSDTTKLVGNYSRSTNGYIAGIPYSAVCTWDYDYTGGQENYAIY